MSVLLVLLLLLLILFTATTAAAPTTTTNTAIMIIIILIFISVTFTSPIVLLLSPLILRNLPHGGTAGQRARKAKIAKIAKMTQRPGGGPEGRGAENCEKDDSRRKASFEVFFFFFCIFYHFGLGTDGRTAGRAGESKIAKVTTVAGNHHFNIFSSFFHDFFNFPLGTDDRTEGRKPKKAKKCGLSSSHPDMCKWIADSVILTLLSTRVRAFCKVKWLNQLLPALLHKNKLLRGRMLSVLVINHLLPALLASSFLFTGECFQ